MLRPALFIHSCLFALLLAALPRVVPAAGTAIVRGATSLNVRSGPGREFPSFTTLQEGTTVEVETTEGSWVRIRTPEGETGYVHKAFLDAVAAQEVEQAVEQGKAQAEAEPALANTEASPAVVEGAEVGLAEPPDLQSEVLAGQERLEHLVEGLHVDMKRLLEVTEGMRGDRAPTPMRVGVTAVNAAESGSLLGLSIIGLVAGFILGMIYGRRKERGRRTRVRF